MMRPLTASSLLVLMGSLDCLTTIIGIVGFGAVEGNPVLGGLARSNLAVFTAIRLGSAFLVGLLFYLAEKSLNHVGTPDSRDVKLVRIIVNAAYAVSVGFLAFVVLNNVWTIVLRPA